MFVYALIVVLALVAAVAAQSNPVRVTCIGDSITEGGACNLSYSYVNVLQEMLGSGFAVTNAGVSAKTMLKQGQCNGGGDCSYWNTATWPKALASTPDIVTIMLGTNDAKVFNWEGVQQNTGMNK